MDERTAVRMCTSARIVANAHLSLLPNGPIVLIVVAKPPSTATPPNTRFLRPRRPHPSRMARRPPFIRGTPAPVSAMPLSQVFHGSCMHRRGISAGIFVYRFARSLDHCNAAHEKTCVTARCNASWIGGILPVIHIQRIAHAATHSVSVKR